MSTDPQPRARRRTWWRRHDAADVGSFRRQLVVSTAVLGALVAIALVGVVQVVLAGTATDTVDRVLRDRADAVVSSVDSATGSDRLSVPDARLDPGVAVYDAQGQLVAGDVAPSQASVFASLSRTGRWQTRRIGDSYELLAQPFTTSAGPSGVVVLSEPLAPYENDEHYALAVSLAAGGLIVFLATGLAAWASRRALAPVATMAQTAEEWSEHDLDRRFDLGPPSNEIRALGHTLDGLLDKVAHAILAEQRLTSELAHELRSPLTAVQATAEMMAMRDDLDAQMREDIGDIQASCRTMAATVTSLLDLARAQSSAATASASDLRGVLEVVVHDVEHQRIDMSIDPAIEVAVPRELAARALAPVVDNAVRLADRVSISATQRDGKVHIVVSDDGPGVPPEAADDIFEPGNTSGSGSGLGLALSRRIARSVGGDVRLSGHPTPGVPGSGAHAGATFVITLPSTSSR